MGGAFDPVHVGHLWICHEAMKACDLDRIFLLPSFIPPHKAHCTAPFHDRLQMLRLALEQEGSNHGSLLSTCDLENHLGNPSFSFRTVQALRQAWGPTIWLAFIIGTDALAEIDTWYHAAGFVELCNALLVAGRPSHGLHCPLPCAKKKLVFLGDSPFAISSTMIRERLQNEAPIRYLVPDTVEEFILKKGLYVGHKCRA